MGTLTTLDIVHQLYHISYIYSFAWPSFDIVLCRYAVIDISAGPCSYGRLESEEGSVGHRTVPRLQHLLLPARSPVVNPSLVEDVFCGQISGTIVSALEHVIAPDVRQYALSSMLPDQQIQASYLIQLLHIFLNPCNNLVFAVSKYFVHSNKAGISTNLSWFTYVRLTGLKLLMYHHACWCPLSFCETICIIAYFNLEITTA